MTRAWTLLICGIGLLAGCTKEPPSRSVTEFIEDPILLEAAMVRCAQDRAGMRYESDCVNARAAVSRIQAEEEAADQADLDASFERKRQALRRTQAVVAETRRRASEAGLFHDRWLHRQRRVFDRRLCEGRRARGRLPRSAQALRYGSNGPKDVRVWIPIRLKAWGSRLSAHGALHFF